MRHLIAFLLLSLSCAAPCLAATLKIATIAPEGSHWMTEMRKAAEEIDKKTTGRVKLKFYGGGVMGNDRSVLRKIRVGQLDGGAFVSGGLAEDCPNLRVYGVPFLFSSQEDVQRVRKEFDPVLRNELEKAGFVNFGFADGGFALLFGNAPVDSLAALKGKKIWAPEGDKMTYSAIEALGLSPVSLPITDVTTGLETRLLDIVATSPIGAVAFQWHTRVRHMTTTPLAYLYGVLAVKKASFDALSAADQAVTREVLERLYRQLDQKNREDEAAALKALVGAGIKPVTPSREEVALWRSLTQSNAEKLASEGLFSKDLFLKVKTLAEASGDKAGK